MILYVFLLFIFFCVNLGLNKNIYYDSFHHFSNFVKMLIKFKIISKPKIIFHVLFIIILCLLVCASLFIIQYLKTKNNKYISNIYKNRLDNPGNAFNYTPLPDQYNKKIELFKNKEHFDPITKKDIDNVKKDVEKNIDNLGEGLNNSKNISIFNSNINYFNAILTTGIIFLTIIYLCSYLPSNAYKFINISMFIIIFVSIYIFIIYYKNLSISTKITDSITKSTTFNTVLTVILLVVSIIKFILCIILLLLKKKYIIYASITCVISGLILIAIGLSWILYFY